MKANLRHNYFWFVRAIETYGLGIFFIISHSTGIFMPPGNILDCLDDPPFIFTLAVVGTIALVYSLWDMHRMPFYKPIMTGSLTFVWLMFFCAFGFEDWTTGKLSFQTMSAFFVLFSIVGQLLIKKG